MTKVKIEDIRNVVICGHGSAGKTTLVDTMLSNCGAVDSQPSVDEGTSVCDFDPEEKDHKYSIEAAVVNFDQFGKRFNLIDTPGYPDFIGQAISAMAGVDLALIAVNAHSGIEVNTRRVFAEHQKDGRGRMIVVTKMDDENVDLAATVDSIRDMWGSQCVLLNVPQGQGSDFRGVLSTLHVPDDISDAVIDPNEIHEALIESIIEVDETVMERYFEGTPPTDEQVANLIVHAVADGTLVPIVCCSAKNNIGVTEILEAIAKCGPNPTTHALTGTKEDQDIAVKADPEGELVARIFRTRVDPFVQKLSFIRVYSGTIKRDDTVVSDSSRKGIKLGPLLRVLGESTTGVEEAGPGDIVAIAKMDEFHTGTNLGETRLPKLRFPTPMVGLAVTPKSRNDETKLSGALHKVVEEDPTFHIDRDPQTKELVVTGMSELHLTVIQQRLKRRDKLEVDTKEPKIPFRETILTESEGSYRHKKQSGGRGQFGEVHIRMFPLPRGTDISEYATKARFHSMKTCHYDEVNNFLWVDSVVGGVIPGNFMPAIEKGFKERMTQGVIAGHQVQDVCVEVHFGKHHPVDSSEAAFKTAGKQVFRKVFEQANPTLLEPIVNLDVTIPEDNVGDVYSDMSSRGGHISGSDSAGGNFTTVHIEVPLREVTTYSRSLSSMTGGMGSFSMEFSHYDSMPANIQHDIVSKAQIHEDEEE